MLKNYRREWKVNSGSIRTIRHNNEALFVSLYVWCATLKRYGYLFSFLFVRTDKYKYLFSAYQFIVLYCFDCYADSMNFLMWSAYILLFSLHGTVLLDHFLYWSYRNCNRQMCWGWSSVAEDEGRGTPLFTPKSQKIITNIEFILW